MFFDGWILGGKWLILFSGVLVLEIRMISLQTGPRASLGGSARDDASFQVKLEPSSSSLSLVPFRGRDSHHEGEQQFVFLLFISVFN